MTKAKISQYDAVAANNTDVNGVNIAEGCPPSGMNNMGREIMAALKRFQTGADGDSVTVGGSLVVSNTLTAGPVSATTLNTSGAVVFNDAGADVDFRVESDTNENALFVDGELGNIGVNVVPNAWNSDYKSIDVSTYGSFYSRVTSPETGIMFNAYRTEAGPFVYRNDAAAAVYSLDSGLHIWYTAASGTAGNNISLTERMRINSSGNLAFPNGQGIDFSASAGGGASSSILDDYEEGTWTPEVRTGSEATFTTSVGSATYTKIGRQVIAQCHGTFTSTASTSQGQLYLTALPFSVAGGNVGDAGGNGVVTSISGQEMGSVMYFNTNGTLIANKSQVDSGGSGVSRTYRIYFSYVAA